MEFPEQISRPRLLEELNTREEKLDEQLASQPALPSAETVEGGTLQRRALGRARIEADGSSVCPVSRRHYKLSIRYEQLPRTDLQIETTPSRLVRVGDHWLEDGLRSDWKRSWALPAPEDHTMRLTFLVPGRSLTLDRPRPRTEKEERGTGYHIPPLATEIRGEGELVYWTGHQREVSGTQTLGRPAADGSLRVRPGGVYATFYGDSQPEVKLGNSWIQARPIS